MSALLKSQGLLDMHARGVGHTTAVVKLAQAVNGILIVASDAQRDVIIREIRGGPVPIIFPLHAVESGHAMGLRRPVIVDHYAYTMLIAEVEQELSILDADNRRLHQQAQDQASKIQNLERENCRLAERVSKAKKKTK